ncbi:hypothetical protein BJX65DRAFT_280864 [Aspergillus insuetus]
MEKERKDQGRAPSSPERPMGPFVLCHGADWFWSCYSISPTFKHGLTLQLLVLFLSSLIHGHLSYPPPTLSGAEV